MYCDDYYGFSIRVNCHHFFLFAKLLLIFYCYHGDVYVDVVIVLYDVLLTEAICYYGNVWHLVLCGSINTRHC